MMDLIKKGGSLNAQRYLTAIDMLNPERLEDASRSLWLRLFEQVCLNISSNFILNSRFLYNF